MERTEIIKALECCSKNCCVGCPYDEIGTYSEYVSTTIKNALALIKSQQKQIKGLNSAIDALRDVAKDYEHHNENLKKENKYLRERLAEEMEHKEDMEGTK